MNTVLKNDIIRAILLMRPIDRIEIINKVFDNFNLDKDEDYETLWAEESERRIAGFLDGSIEAFSMDEVFTQINNMR